MFYKDEQAALMFLRMIIGLVFAAHAILKFAIFGFVGSGQWFTVLGLWSFLVYPVTIIEFCAGVALLIGFYSRWAAAALVPIAAGITWAHWHNGWVFSAPNGGWEYPAVLLGCLIAIIIGGSGRLSMSKD